MFRFVEHQADLAVEVEAGSREGFHRSALEALITLLFGGFPPITTPALDAPLDNFILDAQGGDEEEVLVSSLNALLGLCQIDGWIPYHILYLAFTEGSLSVTFSGQKDQTKHFLIREIKAATYHQLTIQKQPTWKARIVFDA